MKYVVVSDSEIWAFFMSELIKIILPDYDGTYLVGKYDMDYLLKEELDYLFFDLEYLEDYRDRIRKPGEINVKNLVCISLDSVPNRTLSNVTYIGRDTTPIQLNRMLDSIVDYSNSKYDFSTRDISMLYLLKRGASNREIGEKLYLSEKTVKNNLTRIYRVLNVENRYEAIIKLNNMEKI